MEGSKVFAKCPVCKEQIEMKQLNPHVGSSALASVFGMGVMLNVHANQVNADNELAIKKHLDTHPQIAFLQALVDKDARISILRAALIELRDHVKDDTPEMWERVENAIESTAQ